MTLECLSIGSEGTEKRNFWWTETPNFLAEIPDERSSTDDSLASDTRPTG